MALAEWAGTSAHDERAGGAALILGWDMSHRWRLGSSLYLSVPFAGRVSERETAETQCSQGFWAGVQVVQLPLAPRSDTPLSRILVRPAR